VKLPPTFVSALDARVAACRMLPLQLRGAPHLEVTDPLTGMPGLANLRRAGRPRPTPGGCPFCLGRTPPTLFYVPATPAGEEGVGAPRPGAPEVETEGESLELIRRLTADDPTLSGDPLRLINQLGDHHRYAPDGERLPVVMPGGRWRARTFLNAVPLVVDPAGEAQCFVVAVAPAYHDSDLGILLPGRDRVPGEPLPSAVVEALVLSWLGLEAWARERDLLPVPFINGGRDPLSGQSIACFHSQVCALAHKQAPPAYAALREQRERRGCPLCRIVADPGLCVADLGPVLVAAHPAPEREYTWLVLPRDHLAWLDDLPSLEQFAAGLTAAARLYERLLGGVPAYVLVVRSGEEAGHLHAEIVPRAGVNVPGGFEQATGLFVVSRDPRAVVAELREAGGAGS